LINPEKGAVMSEKEHEEHGGDDGDHGGGNGHDKVTIHIDKEKFKVNDGSMTGAQLRQLPTPAIGADRDLVLVVPGPADDILVGDEQEIELKDGMHFFTAPSTINPGVDAPPC
jgi:hypothetical protein